MTAGTHTRLDLDCTYDVLVIGGGNAALCAAMTDSLTDPTPPEPSQICAQVKG